MLLTLPEPIGSRQPDARSASRSQVRRDDIGARSGRGVDDGAGGIIAPIAALFVTIHRPSSPRAPVYQLDLQGGEQVLRGAPVESRQFSEGSAITMTC